MPPHPPRSSAKPRQRPSATAPLPDILAARFAALEALRAICLRHSPLDVALRPVHNHATLSAMDRALAEHLIRVVLKRRLWLEPVLSACLTKKPYASLPKDAQFLLLMGAAQIHYLHIPAYAAVDTTVELARYLGLSHVSGMINAVLKRVATAPLPEAITDVMAHVPAWLRERLIQDYGREQAALLFRQSLADISTVDITLKDDSRHSVEGERIGGASVRIPAGQPIHQMPGYEEGVWWVQDIAASLPVYGIRHLVKGAYVMDACAAPGGKTMQLASYGAKVVALDRSAPRFKRLHENLARTHLTAEVVCADLLTYTPATPFDVVVLDAPCSATGTLRRNPDILYHRTEEDIVQVIALQRQILAHVAEWVKPGGYLLYAVCSLLKAEGEAQIAWLQQAFPHWQRAAFAGIDAAMLDAHGAYRALPVYRVDEGGMDGFYACLLQRP